MRHCVCGTLNHEEGSTDDKAAQLNNIHERCISSEDNEDFHSDVLKCNSSSSTSDFDLLPDICKLGSCYTDGYCFKWLVREGSKITTTYGCLPKEMLQPRERPFICHASQAKAHKFLVSCCWEEDGCNANLSLAFPESTSFFAGLGSSAENMTHRQNFPLLIFHNY